MSYLLTNGKRFVGPFESIEAATDIIKFAELLGWYILPMTEPAKFDPFEPKLGA